VSSKSDSYWVWFWDLAKLVVRAPFMPWATGNIDNTGFFEAQRERDVAEAAAEQRERDYEQQLMAAIDAAFADRDARAAEDIDIGQLTVPNSPLQEATSVRELLERAQGNTSPATTYTPPPGITLPNKYKCAYRSAELYARQRDMRTHCAGVQNLLRVIQQAVCEFTGMPDLAMPSIVFVINFGTGATAEARVYSVKVTEPSVLDFQISQFVDDNMNTHWWCTNAAMDQVVIVRPENWHAEEPVNVLPLTERTRVIDL